VGESSASSARGGGIIMVRRQISCGDEQYG